MPARFLGALLYHRPTIPIAVRLREELFIRFVKVSRVYQGRAFLDIKFGKAIRQVV